MTSIHDEVTKSSGSFLMDHSVDHYDVVIIVIPAVFLAVWQLPADC